MTLKQPILKEKNPFEISISKSDNDLNKYFTESELKEIAKKLAYMERYSKNYKSYNNVNELFEELDS